MAFTPAVRGWAASQARLYFFALEVLKYVSFEHAGDLPNAASKVP